MKRRLLFALLVVATTIAMAGNKKEKVIFQDDFNSSNPFLTQRYGNYANLLKWHGRSISNTSRDMKT